MAYLQDFWKDQWYNIMFFIVIMLTLIALFSILGINFKDDQNKELKKIRLLKDQEKKLLFLQLNIKNK